MYKYLLCWRYLKTRYIALASIVSVMLGVATMIVVNSVMAGFSHEMNDRLHSILSDLVFESHSLEGFPDAEMHMREIRRVAGDDIAGMTPTVHVPGMLAFQNHGRWITRQVQIIGVDEKSLNDAGDVTTYLQHPENRERFSFLLREGGYQRPPTTVGGEPRTLPGGWKHRREAIAIEKAWDADRKARGLPAHNAPPQDIFPVDGAAAPPAAAGPVAAGPAGGDPFHNVGASAPVNQFDPAKEQMPGIVLGIALGTYRDAEGREQSLILPGDDVKLTFPTAGTPPRAVDFSFTTVDLWESKMSEYDSTLVFVPISKLQELRGMVDPQSGTRFVSTVQIKLKPGADLDTVRDKLRHAFPSEMYAVSTWRDKQGPLLAAVQMETAILNVLLFLIVAVAGFGILAIFFMIVVEKTRDIGILKSLGASGSGILGVFLGYGLTLGVVGAGVGMVLGLLFVANINQIADLLGRVTGQPIFNPEIYYFYKIPTIVDTFTVTWIVVGALGIAVLASVLPAFRAATLHPVEALRHE